LPAAFCIWARLDTTALMKFAIREQEIMRFTNETPSFALAV
jgi:hypothetical protein